MTTRFHERASQADGVEACWEVVRGSFFISHVPADGCVDVVVRCGAGGPRLEVEQATVSAFEVQLAAPAVVLGVRLKQGYGEPLREHRASLAQAALALWQRGALSLTSLEQLVAARVQPPPSVVQDFVALAKAQQGQVVLSSRSERTLQRAAKQWLGLRPKTLLRIERARAALVALEQGAPIVDVSCDLGFADQAHLTRELRHLMGANARQSPAQKVT